MHQGLSTRLVLSAPQKTNHEFTSLSSHRKGRRVRAWRKGLSPHWPPGLIQLVWLARWVSVKAQGYIHCAPR